MHTDPSEKTMIPMIKQQCETRADILLNPGDDRSSAPSHDGAVAMLFHILRQLSMNMNPTNDHTQVAVKAYFSRSFIVLENVSKGA